jgi:hypothetical protein
MESAHVGVALWCEHVAGPHRRVFVSARILEIERTDFGCSEVAPVHEFWGCCGSRILEGEYTRIGC